MTFCGKKIINAHERDLTPAIRGVSPSDPTTNSETITWTSRMLLSIQPNYLKMSHPGQGMSATNINRDKNWDAIAWPSLHPSGKYNLHHERVEEQII